jgi:hypothetical protein
MLNLADALVETVRFYFRGSGLMLTCRTARVDSLNGVLDCHP